MAKIHIALVGGQTYPVYLGIAETSPDKVILVHSTSSLAEAQRIAAEFEGSGIPFSFEQCDPVNVKLVLEKTRELSEAMGDEDQFIINLTSGTKVWSILFHEAFETKPHVQFIYVDQSCSIYDLSNGDSRQGDMLDTDLVFRLNDTRAVSYMEFNDLTDEDLDAIRTIRSLHMFNWNDFTGLTVDNTPEKKKKFARPSDTYTHNGSSITWDRETNIITIELKNKDRNGMPKVETLSSEHIFDLVFNAGWFEAEVARHLSQWIHSHEVRLSVEFPYKEGNPKNEIDVIVNTGNRLLFVECKTIIHTLTDLDKFSKAVRNYGGTGCHALFVSYGSMSPRAEEKCRDNGIIPFSFRDALLAASEEERPFAIQKSLHQLLDKRLLTINKK